MSFSHRVLQLLVVSTMLLPVMLQAAGQRSVTDLAGRVVKLPVKVEHILLGESRYIPTLAIIEPQVIKKIAGMMGDWRRSDLATYGQYLAQFPSLAKIPEVGANTVETFSLEKSITVVPDVAIFGIQGHGPSARNKQVIQTLEAAGVAVVFIDFRRDPLANTIPSMRLLGQVLNKQREAEAFIDFYQQQMAKVSAKPPQQPVQVFIHSRVGLFEECCESMARGMLADLVVRAGGVSQATKLLPGSSGVINLEYLISHQPDMYLATAIGAASTATANPGRIILGPDANQQVARKTLQYAITKNRLDNLSATKNNKAYALWHHFYNSPFNVAAVQQLAKWMYPDVYSALDPEKTMRTIYQQFQPVDYRGVYWVDLQD